VLREETRRSRTAGDTTAALALTLLSMLWSASVLALDLFPSQEELEKYNRSWIPLTHGSLLIPLAETLPKGRLSTQAFAFGQIGSGQYLNTLTTHVSAAPVNTNAVVPGGLLTYGLTDHVTIGAGLSGIYWRSTDATGGHDSASGLGDTSIYLTTRHLVQDPETWQPSISLYHRISLPTSHWAGTEPPPGGFEPFSPRPSTRFGALSLTEGLLVSKNLRPFRVNSAIYYTYSTPGNQTAGPETAYPGDLLDARISVEYVVDEDRGFGIILGGLLRKGLSYRLDGHDLNVTPVDFSLIGVNVALEYRFTSNLFADVACLFTVAGQNDLYAFYPGISVKYLW
jgi:hypothetical protein